MAKFIKIKTFRRIVSSFFITTLACLILSFITYKGHYFQNWLNSAYAPHKQITVTGWFLLFVYYGICLFCLWHFNKQEYNYLFLFGIQFFTFAIYVISFYCFSAYVLATVSIAVSVIFSMWLVILLFKNKQYVLMSLLAIFVLLYLYFLFCGVINCSLEYGVWKD